MAGFSFPDFGAAAASLNLLGTASIESGDRLRLTPAAGGQAGAAWYASEPQYVAEQFSTTFRFQMAENVGNLGGSDGFTFAIQNSDPFFLSNAGGNLAYFGLQNSIVVEFDTFRNSEFSDPSESHISVHTAGTAANRPHESYSLGAFSTNPILDDAAIHTAKIEYQQGNLSIYLDDLMTPVLIVAVDLPNTLALNHGRAWLGFTAATGGGLQTHDILDWFVETATPPSTSISIGNLSLAEGATGKSDFVFTITRAGDTTGVTTLDWTTINESAIADCDFTAASGQIEFGPGETTKQIKVSVNADTTDESDETFSVRLSNIVGGALVDTAGRATIWNDDVPVSIDDITITEGDHTPHYRGPFVQGVPESNFNDLTFGPDGNLYASPGGVGSRLANSLNTIQRYDGSTGAHMGTFVPEGRLAGVRDIVFRDGHMYVGSENTDEVLRFDAGSGAFVDVFVAAGSGDIDGPHGLTFGPDANGDGVPELYVSGRNSNNVIRYDGATGEPLGNEQFIATGLGGLRTPEGLTFDPAANQLYVTSSGTNRVLKYDAQSGAYQGVGASTGLSAPDDVKFGVDGLLYVSSGGNDRIVRFNASGTYVDDFVPAGSGGMDNPYRMTFGPDGDLYVSALRTSHILRFGTQSEAVFTVTLARASSIPITIDVATADGSAITGSDYTATNRRIAFAPGTTSQMILVPILDDAASEPSETFTINLSNAVGATIADGQGIGTIQDTDISGPAISISDATAIEGSDTLKFIDRFVPDGSGGLSRARGATFGPDGNGDGAMDLYVGSVDTNQVLRYDGLTGAFIDVFVTAGSGGLDGPFHLKFFGPNNDLFVTGRPNNGLLRFNGATGAFIEQVIGGAAHPSGLTVGDDGYLYVSNLVGDNVLRYDGAQLREFIAIRAGGLNEPSNTIFGPDANHDGIKDAYVGSLSTGQILRYDGVTGTFIDVFVQGQFALGPIWLQFGSDGYLYATDRTSPQLETSIVRFDSSSGAPVDRLDLGRDGSAFMIGPDNIVYSSSNGAGGFVERFGHSSLVAFTVSLDAPSASPVTVNYTTANGSASAGNDYLASSGTLTFAPGQTTQTILVKTLDDEAAEPSETFTVTLSNSVGAPIVDAQGVGTIQDDDDLQTPTLTAVATAANRVNLTWTDGSIGETGFKIERTDAGAPGQFVQVATVGANVTSYNDLNLQSSSGYTYRVRAYNAARDGAASNTATATTPQLHTINGTGEDDLFFVVRDGMLFKVYQNTEPTGQPTFSSQLAAMTGVLTLNAGHGDDVLTVDTGGEPTLGLAQLIYDAGLGANSLVMASGSARIDSTAAGTGTLDTIVLPGAQLTTSRLKQNELAVADGGRVTILPDGTLANVLGGLDLDMTGTLDVADNDLIVKTTAANKSAVLGALYGRLVSGFANGAWNGPGLVSSAATSNPDTTLSMVDNALFGHTTFGGEPVDANAILFKHTYYGDIDQNGAVDADDLTVFANNFGRRTGATQVDGDIDFNGTVDADDLTVFANNFGRGIGSPLAASPPSSSRSSFPSSAWERTTAKLPVESLWVERRFAHHESPVTIQRTAASLDAAAVDHLLAIEAETISTRKALRKRILA
jgi:sugar lactone lactonase YvrE